MNGSEPIRFQCVHCGKGLRVASDAAGKRVRCPKCSGLAVVPFPLESEAEVTEARTRNAAGTGRSARPLRRDEAEYNVPGARRSLLPWAVGGGIVLIAFVGVTIWLATRTKTPNEPAGPSEVAAARNKPSNPQDPPPPPKDMNDADRSRELEQKLIGTWTCSIEDVVIVMGLDKAGKVTEVGFLVNQGTGYAGFSDDKWHYKLVLRDSGADLVIYDGSDKAEPREKYGIESVDSTTMTLSRFDIRVNRFVTQTWKRISDNPRYWKERATGKKADPPDAPGKAVEVEGNESLFILLGRAKLLNHAIEVAKIAATIDEMAQLGCTGFAIPCKVNENERKRVSGGHLSGGGLVDTYQPVEKLLLTAVVE
jgi:DNA-directed RNA polymerase subunit RPC12/RpoP